MVIHFDATVDPGIIVPTMITNIAMIADGAGRSWLRQAYVYVLYHPGFLSLVIR